MKFVRPPLKLPVGFLHEIKLTGEKKEVGRLLKGRGKAKGWVKEDKIIRDIFFLLSFSSPLFAIFTREAVPSLTGGLIEFMHPREAAASGKVERTYVLANAG